MVGFQVHYNKRKSKNGREDETALNLQHGSRVMRFQVRYGAGMFNGEDFDLPPEFSVQCVQEQGRTRSRSAITQFDEQSIEFIVLRGPRDVSVNH